MANNNTLCARNILARHIGARRTKRTAKRHNAKLFAISQQNVPLWKRLGFNNPRMTIRIGGAK